jgi:antitoxin component of RelBE/YafQ-DinJ toxin-antitoxin module
MTVKLNLTIDEDVVQRTKRFAKKRNISISKIVQEYLDKTTQNEKVKVESFVEKYAGTLNGQLSEKEIARLKTQRAKEKYGY